MKEKIIEALKDIYDPEIPINIYELGLIYDVSIEEDKVEVLMTLTTANCPVAESLPVQVQERIREVPGAEKAKVILTFDPPWDQSRLSDEAKLAMGLL